MPVRSRHAGPRIMSGAGFDPASSRRGAGRLDSRLRGNDGRRYRTVMCARIGDNWPAHLSFSLIQHSLLVQCGNRVRRATQVLAQYFGVVLTEQGSLEVEFVREG